MSFRKFIQFNRLLFRERQWRTLLNPGEIILSISGVVFALYWYFSSAEVLIESFSMDGVKFLSGIFLLSHFFHSIHSAKTAIRSYKVVFYRIIGFTRLDVCLLILSTFFMSGVAFSFFFGVAFNLLILDIGLWVAVPYFFILVAVVLSLLFILSKINRNPVKIKKKNQYSGKLFSNKYTAYILKEVSEVFSHPFILLYQLFIAVVIGFFIFIRLQNYLIVVYILCFLSAMYCYDSYEADGKRHFLYKLLNFSKYRIFKYKLLVSVTIGFFWIFIYSLLYVIFIGSFSWTFLLLPLVLLNALAQYAALGIICCRMYPYAQPFSVDFFAWSVLSAIPVLSFILFVYAYKIMMKLRKADHYA